MLLTSTMEVRPERRTALAFRWIKNYARDRKDKSMALKVAAELMAAANGEGSSVKKKMILIVWLKQIKHLLILSGN